MNLFIYSDESGVFDAAHNDYYVFGGLIFMSEEDIGNASRKYIAVENTLRENGICNGNEIKAAVVSAKHKRKLYNSLKEYHKFAVVIREKDLNANIFMDKKSKQRFLDYAYKRAVKNGISYLMDSGFFGKSDIEKLSFFIDEHTTATNGRYELKEALDGELSIGTFNYSYNHFYPPIFSNRPIIKLKFCDSKSKTLVRAADIVANKVWHMALSNQLAALSAMDNIVFMILP